MKIIKRKRIPQESSNGHAGRLPGPKAKRRLPKRRKKAEIRSDAYHGPKLEPKTEMDMLELLDCFRHGSCRSTRGSANVIMVKPWLRKLFTSLTLDELLILSQLLYWQDAENKVRSLKRYRTPDGKRKKPRANHKLKVQHQRMKDRYDNQVWWVTSYGLLAKNIGTSHRNNAFKAVDKLVEYQLVNRHVGEWNHQPNRLWLRLNLTKLNDLCWEKLHHSLTELPEEREQREEEQHQADCDSDYED